MIKNFFVITNHLFDDSVYAYGETFGKEIFGNFISCSECGTPISMREWLPPYKIKLSKPKFGDFIFGTFIGVIFSEKVKNVILKNNIKGINSISEVELFYKKSCVETFYYPKIEMINAFVDYSKINIKGDVGCSTCQRGGRIITDVVTYDSISFLNSSVINEDIFYTSSLGQAHLFISERFKNLIVSNSFTNIRFMSV